MSYVNISHGKLAFSNQKHEDSQFLTTLGYVSVLDWK